MDLECEDKEVEEFLGGEWNGIEEFDGELCSGIESDVDHDVDTTKDDGLKHRLHVHAYISHKWWVKELGLLQAENLIIENGEKLSDIHMTAVEEFSINSLQAFQRCYQHIFSEATPGAQDVRQTHSDPFFLWPLGGVSSI